MDTHSWQQIKSCVDAHLTHTQYVLSWSSLMRRCCRNLQHCRADPSGSSTKPVWNSAILTPPYAIFHTSGLKRIWAYRITPSADRTNPSGFPVVLMMKAKEWMKKKDWSQENSDSWTRLSLSPPGLDQPQDQSPEGNLISDTSDNIKSTLQLLQSFQSDSFYN